VRTEKEMMTGWRLDGGNADDGETMTATLTMAREMTAEMTTAAETRREMETIAAATETTATTR